MKVVIDHNEWESILQSILDTATGLRYTLCLRDGGLCRVLVTAESVHTPQGGDFPIEYYDGAAIQFWLSMSAFVDDYDRVKKAADRANDWLADVPF